MQRPQPQRPSILHLYDLTQSPCCPTGCQAKPIWVAFIMVMIYIHVFMTGLIFFPSYYVPAPMSMDSFYNATLVSKMAVDVTWMVFDVAGALFAVFISYGIWCIHVEPGTFPLRHVIAACIQFTLYVIMAVVAFSCLIYYVTTYGFPGMPQHYGLYDTFFGLVCACFAIHFICNMIVLGIVLENSRARRIYLVASFSEETEPVRTHSIIWRSRDDSRSFGEQLGAAIDRDRAEGGAGNAGETTSPQGTSAAAAAAAADQNVDLGGEQRNLLTPEHETGQM